MIFGVGTDIIEIPRVAAVWGDYPDRFAIRILTSAEMEQQMELTPDFLARAWATKEAVAKALGTGIGERVGFKDIQVSAPGKGKPFVRLSERVRDFFPNILLHVSLSHTGGIMQAFVLAELVSGTD